jgi:hypothetical protein
MAEDDPNKDKAEMLLMAEDGSMVGSSFYQGKVRAEDGSWVPISFFLDAANDTDTFEPSPFTFDRTITDLGSVIDKLTDETPFDYHERHVWNGDRTDVLHYLDIGYPKIGVRRNELRFVVGENIRAVPAFARNGMEYANHVQVFGAGEGSAQIWAESRRGVDRLRRMAVIQDKNISSGSDASMRARSEMIRRMSTGEIEQVVISNDGSTPLGSFGPGDEIRISSTNMGWIDHFDWYRVLSVTYQPEKPDIMVASLQKSDREVV